MGDFPLWINDFVMAMDAAKKLWLGSGGALFPTIRDAKDTPPTALPAALFNTGAPLD